VIAAALVAACGSGKKSTAKDDFIAQADGICGAYNDLVSKATRTVRRPGPRRAVAAVQNRLAPLLERRDAELAHLQPPDADRATIARFLADLKAATADAASDPSAYIAAHGATPLARKAAAEAAAYGFSVCARI
jgi:hypothetical protein